MLKLLTLFFIYLILVSAEETDESSFQPLTNAQIWGFGVLAGVGISLLGFFAAFVLVFAKKCCSVQCFEIILRFMFSLSCGALLGDAVIHILAESYANQETNKLIVSLILILAMLFFLVMDRLLHSFGIAHAHWVGQKCEGENQNHGHHHHQLSDHNHEHIQQQDPDSQKNKGQERSQKKDGSMRGSGVLSSESKLPLSQIHINNGEEIIILSKNKKKNNKINPQKPHDHDHNHDHNGHSHSPEHAHENHPISEEIQVKQKNCCENLKGKGAAGYMNIFGSAIHNVFDGLALGIAFATGNPTQIIPVVVAIIAHEIPRELGDVAILLKSQFTQIQTICCNGLVNFLSLIGVFIGLAIIQIHETVKLYILVFVAGNFIYIAADIWQHIFKNKGQGAKLKNGLQVFGLGVGIGAMFALTLLQTE